jgi:DNA-binding transcriptional ArsR family regulator
MHMVVRKEISKLDQYLLPSCQILRGMSNGDRLSLLCSLIGGAKTVKELGEATGVYQPTLSQQLKVLKEEGIISSTREGTFMRYSIANPLVISMMKLLYDQYCEQ